MKLLAYELLLRNDPTWRKRLTLVQVCFPYSHSPDESSEVSREIREVVARIKAEFGDAAVHYWEVGAELAMTPTHPPYVTSPRAPRSHVPMSRVHVDRGYPGESVSPSRTPHPRP